MQYEAVIIFQEDKYTHWRRISDHLKNEGYHATIDITLNTLSVNPDEDPVRLILAIQELIRSGKLQENEVSYAFIQPITEKTHLTELFTRQELFI